MEENNNNVTDTSAGALAASRIFGEDSNGTTPYQDPLIFQGPEGVCAIRSQQIILRDYGIDISLEELKQFAIDNGWYDPSGEGGTPMGYVGALLASCGVEVRQDVNCTVYDLVNELAQGHRVIVGVDADELWADRDDSIIDKTKTWFDDVFNGEAANHALIVAGVEVNPDDPKDVTVILTDPGTGDLRLEYSLDEFMDAWEDSNCFMTTTTTPAPYQYDPVHGCEVPSNFAVEQYISYNSLPLNADVRGVELASDYEPYYDEGHLDVVGTDNEGHEVTYNEFHEEYAKYKQAIGGVASFGQDHFDKNEFLGSLKSLFGMEEDTTIPDIRDIVLPTPDNPDPDDIDPGYPGHDGTDHPDGGHVIAGEVDIEDDDDTEEDDNIFG